MAIIRLVIPITSRPLGGATDERAGYHIACRAQIILESISGSLRSMYLAKSNVVSRRQKWRADLQSVAKFYNTLSPSAPNQII